MNNQERLSNCWNCGTKITHRNYDNERLFFYCDEQCLQSYKEKEKEKSLEVSKQIKAQERKWADERNLRQTQIDNLREYGTMDRGEAKNKSKSSIPSRVRSLGRNKATRTKKRSVVCSVCSTSGHNARTCPNR